MSSKAGNLPELPVEETKTTFKFTVQKPELAEEVKIEKGPAVFTILLKWIIVALLSLAMSFCLVGSKICLLLIAEHYNMAITQTQSHPNSSLFDNRMKNSTSSNLENAAVSPNNKQSIFIILTMTITIPQLISFLLAGMRIISKQKSTPGPTTKAAMWIFFGSVLEVCSLCYLAITVLTVVDLQADMILVLMSCVFLVPCVTHLYHLRSNISPGSPTSSRILFTLFAIATFCQAAGLAMLTYKLKEVHSRIGVPLALILVSTCWSPKIRKLQTEPRGRHKEQLSHGSHSRAQLKATVISNLIKLLTTPFVAAIMANYFKVAEVGALKDGFRFLTTNNPVLLDFIAQIFCSLGAYCIGVLVCKIRMQRIAFALPLTLATPITLVIINLPWICSLQKHLPIKCVQANDLWFTLLAAGFVCIGQFLCSGYYVWRDPGFIMADTLTIFRIPSYNGIFLEQYLMLNRRNSEMDLGNVNHENMARNTALFMCTTMYHEADFEMKQLLNSVSNLDKNRHQVGRHLEFHVFFDGCIQGQVMNEYVLTLCSLLENTLTVKLNNAVKLKTPYGMQMKWVLASGAVFTIHLKDNKKVKNKKRWSQVMYMSYVLDHRQKVLGIRDENAFILTTDADVAFTHNSVEALIDVLLHNPKIGAVCGRTHPMGNGPIVWYQIFDYAIGHWLLKVANHVFGSVLCCPGCFSVFRTQAIREVLATYATSVDRAFEFLTKDMGEDRWMCTLMIQKGWRLTYSAASEDSTYCPDTFDEFYKQRRRWMPSSLANQALLVTEWKKTVNANENISAPFMIFQVFLMFSTHIGPATVILFVTYGLVESGSFLAAGGETVTVILIYLTTVAFALICLYTPQQFQLRVAKILTFIFAVIMCSVIIGMAQKIVKEQDRRNIKPTPYPTRDPITNSTRFPPLPAEQSLPASLSTIYLAVLSGIFVITAILHPKELFCLINGLWYLLCLPSGYLFLTVYSICNLTDRSWGTRETGTSKQADTGMESLKKYTGILRGNMKRLCCFKCVMQNDDKGSSLTKVKMSDSSRRSQLKEKIRRKLSTMSNSSRRSQNSKRNHEKRSVEEIPYEESQQRSNNIKSRALAPGLSVVNYDDSTSNKDNKRIERASKKRGSLIRVILPPLPPLPEESENDPPPPPPRGLAPDRPPPRIPPRMTALKNEHDHMIVENVSLAPKPVPRKLFDRPERLQVPSADSISMVSDSEGFPDLLSYLAKTVYPL